MIELRELHTAAELAELPVLEERVWGGQLVSVHMLVATVGEGGVAIGAFDDGHLVGAVYGFPTHDPHVLHSHYLAVEPAHRGHGLGLALKMRQRDWCLANGRTAMRWTFDPLQLGNAHLNLHALRAVGVKYHVDLYGVMGGINGSLPSDRLLIEWDLVGQPFVGAESVMVEAPAVPSDEIAAASDVAIGARLAVRDAMAPLMSEGWVVTDFDRASRRYVLSR